MLIDLSRPFSQDMPVFPGDPKPRFEKVSNFERHGFEDHQIFFGNHNGTHMDAPSHMVKGGKRLSDFPLETFTGKGLLIEALERKSLDIDLLKNITIEPGSIVFFRTGHDANFPDITYYREFPVATSALGEALVKANVKIAGFDTPSPDLGPFEFHRILLGHEILIIENLTNLGALSGKSFTVTAFPLKADLDGSPVRVVANF